MSDIVCANPIDISKAASNNFICIIDKLPGIELFVTDVTIPSLSVSYATVPTGKLAQAYSPGTTIEYEELTITAIVDEQYKYYFDVYDWIHQNTNETALAKVFSDATVLLYDNAKKAILKMRFVDCFPTSLSSLEFSVDASNNITFFMTLKYHRAFYERLAN